MTRFLVTDENGVTYRRAVCNLCFKAITKENCEGATSILYYADFQSAIEMPHFADYCCTCAPRVKEIVPLSSLTSRVRKATSLLEEAAVMECVEKDDISLGGSGYVS